jgi:hypothetical protein
MSAIVDTQEWRPQGLPKVSRQQQLMGKFVEIRQCPLLGVH